MIKENGWEWGNWTVQRDTSQQVTAAHHWLYSQECTYVHVCVMSVALKAETNMINVGYSSSMFKLHRVFKEGYVTSPDLRHFRAHSQTYLSCRVVNGATSSYCIWVAQTLPFFVTNVYPAFLTANLIINILCLCCT